MLASLVDKSMLMVDRSGRSTRYRLLETLRQYGEERLGRPRRCGQRSAIFISLHYQMIAEQASAAYVGPGQVDAVRIGEREWDNFRAAFDWAQITGDVEAAISLVLAICRIRATPAALPSTANGSSGSSLTHLATIP